MTNVVPGGTNVFLLKSKLPKRQSYMNSFGCMWDDYMRLNVISHQSYCDACGEIRAGILESWNKYN